MHDMHERTEMIRLKYVFLGNLNAPIQFRYNLNSISWFCLLTIYFNTLVICIMINIFFPAESPLHRHRLFTEHTEQQLSNQTSAFYPRPWTRKALIFFI